MRFTLKQLQYFVAAGEAGSVLRASENIHVSQPSISNAIASLESSYGVRLFVRHHAQGVSLTAAGRELFTEAKAVLSQAERLQSHAGELANKVVGTVKIGFFNPLASVISPRLRRGFIDRYPDVDIQVQEAHQGDLLQLLRQGTIDLAITYDLQLPNEIEFINLATLPPFALMSSEHPLSHCSAVSLEQLVTEPLVLLDLPLSADYFMGLFTAKKLKPVIGARTHLTDVQRGLVSSGLGYGLANVRPVNQSSLDGGSLAYIPLKGSHHPLTLGIAQLQGGQLAAAQSTFVSHCRETIDDYNIPGMIDRL